MTTTLGEIYLDVLFRSGKDMRGGFWSPSRFNIAIKAIADRKINQLVKGFEVNKEETSDLKPFIKTYGSPQYPAINFTPVLSGDNTRGGYASVPEDYWYHARSFYIKTTNDGCDSTPDYTPVEFVPQHIADAKLASSLESPVTNPTENFPILFIQNNLFFIYPYLRRISLTIIKQPEAPFMDYDSVSGMIVFLPAGETHINSSVLPVGTPSRTVEMEFQESCVDELTQMIVEFGAIANENKWNLEANPKVK